MKSPILFLVLFFSLFEISALSQPISESFELRYFSNNPKSNGETDFKGETAVFNTEERVEYLKRYAEIAKEFFNDPELDTKVVSDEQVKQVMSKLKPQPEPEVRKEIPLKYWKWMGYKPGMEKSEAAELQVWKDNKAVEIENEQLRFIRDDEIIIPVARQIWRFFIEWKISGNIADSEFSLASDGTPVAFLEIKGDEMLIHSKGEDVSHIFKQNTAGDSKTLKLEADLENGRYNVYVDEQLAADFIPLLSGQSVNQLVIKGEQGLVLDNVYGVGYEKAEFTEDIHTRDVPFSIKTFIDQDFALKPNMENWQRLDYDDTQWPATTLPHPHGGERFAGEDLYMRTTFTPEKFEKAFLNYETLDPGGEIWINGRIVLVQHQRHPGKLDVSKFLVRGEENIIAVKIFPNKVEHTNRHTSSDIHTGWFSGRMHIDLTDQMYIQDVFTYTEILSDHSAKQKIRINLINEDWEFEEREMKVTRESSGSLRIDFYPWYPEESSISAASKEIPVYLRLMKNEELTTEVTVSEPELWTTERPFLYKVVATLYNEKGNAVDDFVFTTGIRTVSQEGGTFRINGKPSMMNGALLFGYKSPLDKIALWLRAGPEEWLVKEILMIKNMNANTIRMSIHHGMKGGVNDPRMAELGDQLGVMFQWTTGTWVRTGSPWLLDFEGLPKYVKQVRNHPSIVMWQPGNHPKFIDFETETIPWYEKVYNNIYPHDPSRLISPVANNSRLFPRNDDGTLDREGKQVDPIPVWTAPKITRGDMDHATGYGTDWSTLRRYPYPKDWSGEQGWRVAGYRTDYLNSKERAYFDFESEESVAQPNWNLRKGKPSYQIKSYELEYDEGSIGRQLSVDEWEISQAWQAFSAFEAYKKKRWLDYDGLAWCTLHGGGNTATYQKPLIDYYGHAKLSFHTIKMAFQPTLAGSHNVDLVYGPEDEIEPVIMHLGNTKKVNLLVTIKNLDGNAVEQKEYRNILLNEGRSSTDLGSFRPKVQKGYFFIHYQIFRNE
ncbi:MAG: hypothetical protein MUC93_13680 [Bacteroidales bacterium]|jgi:hypothetical protein|nr:hypothetical protein [Bacteroidales bacterium]